jgi:hypothetical protein
MPFRPRASLSRRKFVVFAPFHRRARETLQHALPAETKTLRSRLLFDLLPFSQINQNYSLLLNENIAGE